MAAPTTPNQPAHLGRNHCRRGSTRTSFAPSLIDSPRTLCPRDGDAFSYDPTHLAEWNLPQHLWDSLTPKLQTTVISMQHSGAAVLTGFERLEQHKKRVDGDRPIHKVEGQELIDHLAALPPPKLRTTSDASSTLYSDVPSPVFTDTPNSGCTSPSLGGSQLTSPVSPMCLSPFDSQFLQPPKRERSRERSFSTPREPHDAYYAAELSHLRTEAITRLRHTAIKVGSDLNEAKRANALSADVAKEFEEWLAKKKSIISQLNDQCRNMSNAIGLSPSGMGWTYAS